MPKRTTHRTRERARAMRKDMSFPERLLWSHLKANQLDGIKFRRQAPVGAFITDFLCDEYRLVVELDGRSHDDSAEYDARRTRFLNSQGYRVVRYDHDEFLRTSSRSFVISLATVGATFAGGDSGALRGLAL